MAIICLELICLALIVSSVFITATIGMMSGRIEQLEEDIEKLEQLEEDVNKLKKDYHFAILSRAALREDIKKLNENNRIEVENDGWN